MKNLKHYLTEFMDWMARDLNADQRATVAGIISSRDPKNCEVNVYFFE